VPISDIMKSDIREPKCDIMVGDSIELSKLVEPRSVHTMVTSPPYLWKRKYDIPDTSWPEVRYRPRPDLDMEIIVEPWVGQLGQERSPVDYIGHLVAIFREVKNVLRDDGTAWLNIGDSYVGKKVADEGSATNYFSVRPHGYEAGNLLMLPQSTAQALQADGWFVRSDITWAKSISYCEGYVGSCAPESPTSWRWIRCGTVEKGDGQRKFIPCGGCDKCKDTGGFVLLQHAWRPTQSKEAVFMLTKSRHYYCDKYAVMEEGVYPRGTKGGRGSERRSEAFGVNARPTQYAVYSGKRNLRNVWTVPILKGNKIKHYAAFPPKLVEPCIKASTSDYGCCAQCGMPWSRVITRDEEGFEVANGWKQTCDCESHEVAPCRVLDIFHGSGKAANAAKTLGRDYIGIEISQEFVKESRHIIDKLSA